MRGPICSLYAKPGVGTARWKPHLDEAQSLEDCTNRNSRSLHRKPASVKTYSAAVFTLCMYPMLATDYFVYGQCSQCILNTASPWTPG